MVETETEIEKSLMFEYVFNLDLSLFYYII
jgi:hypothetical protein